MLNFKLDLQFFAHKKGGGSASTNRNHDSNSKNRGVKKYGGQIVNAGNILIRQLGSKFFAGSNTYFGKDYTINAKCNGIVEYYRKKVNRKYKTFVKVIEFPKT